MDTTVRDLLDIVFRWVHLIAGIMWIGNSMLFNWLDRNLVMPPNAKPGMEGEIWMVHSGGFYQVEKKQLAPSQMPDVLHWFKWQAYTTWISGIFLLGIVYYMGGGGFLVDPNVSSISVHGATLVGLGTLLGAWLIYDLLWRSPLGKIGNVAVPLSIAIGAGISFGLTHVLSGRAAYIHVGAMIGTVMAGNVFFHIMPSQRLLVAATKAGQPQDPAVGLAAKKRSIHNNYLTFPLLFIMLSNHFPSTYGDKLNWLILAVIIVAGALVRHFMNIRFWFKGWLPALGATVILALIALFALLARKPATAAVAATPGGPRVSFTSVRLVMSQRCVPCHSATPTDDTWKVAPVGMMFDTPAQIKQHAERIKARSVISKTMPLANKTAMTEDERDLMARWFLAGAPLDD